MKEEEEWRRGGVEKFDGKDSQDVGKTKMERKARDILIE